MYIEFATCVRHTALEYLRQVLPDSGVEDTTESAGPLLDLVQADIVRVQDPMMYGSRVGIVPGTKFREEDRERIIAAGKVLTEVSR
jgi:hypothetical protein